MENLLQRINCSLPAKLIITIALLLIVGVAISCVTLIVNGRNTLMRYTVDHIASSSELVKRSIHYGMLTFDRESIQRIIDSISSKENILGIRSVLTITVGTEPLNMITSVYIRVEDQGQGIPEDELPYIFEPFFSTKEIGHGTGLGLSITRKIIEEHGGFIKAESRPDKGAAFSLYFPFQGDEEAAKPPCWELMQCGRDKDASLKCPAYPHFGRICWVVAGTFCEGKIQGTFAQKSEDCQKCRFYRLVAPKKQTGNSG